MKMVAFIKMGIKSGRFRKFWIRLWFSAGYKPSAAISINKHISGVHVPDYYKFIPLWFKAAKGHQILWNCDNQICMPTKSVTVPKYINDP